MMLLKAIVRPEKVPATSSRSGAPQPKRSTTNVG